jgi:hypothetical protein
MPGPTIDVLVRLHVNGAGEREVVLNVPSAYQGDPSQLVIPLDVARQLGTDVAEAVEAADLFAAAHEDEDDR